MPRRKDLPLEEKLKIPVVKLPFSKIIKSELLDKGVYTLREIINKFNKAPGRICLPGYTKEVYEETSYLITKMNFYKEEHAIFQAASDLESNQEGYYKEKIEGLKKEINNLQQEIPEARRIDRTYAKKKARIDAYLEQI
ncbi:MAG: hypothetical protein KAU20_04905 [Nanoarchaeota archaeon]|nr:hypothetical protein [Nanoarchaeota archaeon]